MANKIAKIQKGKIALTWEGEKKVTLDCTVENDEYVEHDSLEVSNMGKLKFVEVNYGDDESYPLCLNCRTHLVKPVMVEYPEGSGSLEEVFECTNPDCSNKA